MAIHCVDPNKIGTQAEEMYNVTNVAGKNLIKSFKSSIESLASHWKGTDATANLTDLATVYGEVTDLVKKLQTIIVNVNNTEILPLQKVVVASGGECTIGNELAFTLGDCESTIGVPAGTIESWTDSAIFQDAETFNSFPTTFETFVNDLIEAKNTLMSNWLEGAGREDVVALFNQFEQNVADYKTRVTKVRDNINTVAENKKTVMD